MFLHLGNLDKTIVLDEHSRKVMTKITAADMTNDINKHYR